ncbi:MAG TPA: tape measure protein [Tepidisphaeraceae bacterium]|jgi:tape measure domain-containing protein
MSFDAGTIAGKLTLNTLDYERGEARVARGTGEMRRGFNLAEVAASTLGSTLGNMGASAITGGLRSITGSLGGFITDSLKAAAAYEQTGISFEVMLGSADKAKKLLKEIADFAAATPFELPELTGAARKLLSYGFAADQIIPRIRQLGDVSSALQIPLNDLADIYGKAFTQGRLQAEDLNQLTGRGIPIIKELAKQWKVGQDEVRGFVEKGRFGFAELEKAIASMTGEGGLFFGMMARQSASATGLFSTLQDAVGEVEREVGKALIKGSDGKDLLREITGGVERLKPAVVDLAVALASAFREALPYLKDVAAWAESVLAMLGLVDRYRAAGSPYAGARDDQLVARINANKEGVGQIASLWRSAMDTINTGGETIGNVGSFRVVLQSNDSALRAEVDKWASEIDEKRELIAREAASLDQLIARSAKGDPIDASEFERVKKRTAEVVALAERIRELQNRLNVAVSVTPFVSDENKQRLATNAEATRLAYNGAAATVDQLRKVDKAEKEVARTRLAEAEKLKSAREEATAGLAGATPPSVGGTGTGGATRERRTSSLTVSEIASDADRARLQAEIDAANRAGAIGVDKKIDLLERARLDRWLVEQRAKMTNGQEMMGLTLAYAIKLAALEADQAGREQETKARRAATINEAMAATAAAGLELRGKIFDAELLRFDAMWDAKLTTVKDRELRMTMFAQYEAERRLKLQQAGRGNASGSAAAPAAADPADPAGEARRRLREARSISERRLAELDLREATGGTLTAAEITRRSRLRSMLDLDANSRPSPGGADPTVADADARFAAIRDRAARPVETPVALRGFADIVGQSFARLLANRMPSPLPSNAVSPPTRPDARQPAAGTDGANAGRSAAGDQDLAKGIGAEVKRSLLGEVRVLLEAHAAKVTQAFRPPQPVRI